MRNSLSNLIAALVVVMLISGFQLNETTAGKISTIDSMLGIEEAYAGRCNDNGCIGGSDKCMEVKILWGAFQRTCWTTVKSDGPKELQ